MKTILATLLLLLNVGLFAHCGSCGSGDDAHDHGDDHQETTTSEEGSSDEGSEGEEQE